jgi:hypothetical protein
MKEMLRTVSAVGKWWVKPLVLAVGGLVILIIFTKGKAYIPFVYAVF